MPEPDFEQIALRLTAAIAVLPLSYKAAHALGTEAREVLRQAWNARGAADRQALYSDDPPCSTFSESENDDNTCKHCGWTDEAHDESENIKALDR